MYKFNENDLTYIKLNGDAINSFVEQNEIEFRKFEAKPLFIDLLSETPNNKLIFAILFNTINFCFWSKPEWHITFNGINYYRSHAIEILLKQEAIINPRFLTVDYLSKLPFSEFERLIKVEGNLLLKIERWQLIVNTFSIIKEKFNSDPFKLIEISENNAYKLAKLISSEFISFRDRFNYKGKVVHFNKRAQLLASTIANFDFTDLTNTDKLSAFADYRLPQILRHMGIIEYNDILSRLVDDEVQLKSGSNHEIEIRISTILALEKIREKLALNGTEVEVREIDSYLWVTAKNISDDMKPHHKTVSIYY